MKKFTYKVSVIVPVYNAEKYLELSIDSLIAQTVFDDIEVILVNDGSTDRSVEICKRYTANYYNINLINKENEGVSIARNVGMDNANGKYIMFLDADDEFSEETVEAVFNFFEQVGEKVDVVTFPEVKYNCGRRMPKHFRYNTLNETGIYDLKKDIYVAQSRVNVAIKNEDEKVYFDSTLASAEDQEFLARILGPKMKLGFVNKGTYKYNIHALGVSSAGAYVFYVSNVIYDYYKKTFDRYGDNVPGYFQAMFLYDLNWKIRKDQLWPYHFEKEEFDTFYNTIKLLLQKCDVEVIMQHPSLDNYHKLYLLKIRDTQMEVLPNINSLQLVCNNKIIYEEKRLYIVVCQMKQYNGKLKILAHVKSALFDFMEKPELYAVIDDSLRQEVKLFESNASRYKTKIKTNLFWGFYFEMLVETFNKLSFEVIIDGVAYSPNYYFMPYTSIDTDLYGCCMNGREYTIRYENKSFLIEKTEYETQLARYNEQGCAIIEMDDSAFGAFKAFDIFEKKKIWLYYDCRGVDLDNGYYQFIHDFDKNDGIARYYIYNNDTLKEGLFEGKYQKYLVRFGSDLHRKLFINADKILTAFIEKNNVYPFTVDEMKLIKNWMHSEVIYLQHGILHASIPWKYTPEALQIDKIVVSSEFEKQNFITKYNFREEDILPYGMPRLEKLNTQSEIKKKILFAPSWRNYLITPQVDNYWEPIEDVFVKSDYYKKILGFLQSEQLAEVLEKNDAYLEFKLHPIFYNAYKHLFTWKSDRIRFAENSVKNEEYGIFMTDFSSFVFDFAYLRRNIIYFVPDYLQFKSGMNQYREMDFPFEDAFGYFTTEAEEACEMLGNILANDCLVPEQYDKKMSSFFVDIKDCSERLYESLMQNESI